MRILLLSASAVAALSSMAGAQELSLSYGVTATSRYVASGIAQSSGSAIQPWAEVGYGGLYAGLWASNVSRSVTGAAVEVDLSLGYRGAVGKLEYDIGYARYYYTGPFNNCCGQFILDLSTAPNDSAELGLRMAYDPDAGATDARLSADFSVADKFTMGAEVGTVTNGGQNYWSVGGSYSLTDKISVGARWHDSSKSKGVAVLSADYSF